MQRHDQQYQLYCAILRRELAPATGCTEPIALAYCAALARHTLGAMPQRVRVQVSGNIIKNVKSVTVPNTGGLKGIQAAVAAGVVAGNERAGLEVIHAVTPEKQREIAQFLAKTPIAVEPMENCALLDMIVTVYANGHEAGVRISHSHTHVARIERDGQALLCGDGAPLCEEAAPDYGALSVEGICEFASILDTEDVREVLDRQIACNTAIAAEGLKHRWGADIGNVLLETYGSGDVRIRARAMAAAGSDARMSGCEMPVVINSGSGNQGLTVSLPVIEYARAYHKSQDDLYRALAVSNLCAIHQKNAIGKLSAYCGAVTAGSAAGAALKLTTLAALPAGAGLSVLAEPILLLLYPAVPDTARAAAYHLTFLGLACVFVCLMVATNGVLQSYGRPYVPVLTLLCGGVMKIVTNYLMVGDPATGIRGAAVSTLYCYALIVVLNLLAIARYVPERPGYIGLFAKPLLLTAVMALAARSSYGLLAQVLPERWAVLPAILIAAAVYILLALATGAVTRQELLALPKGEKIAQILGLR